MGDFQKILLPVLDSAGKYIFWIPFGNIRASVSISDTMSSLVLITVQDVTILCQMN